MPLLKPARGDKARHLTESSLSLRQEVFAIPDRPGETQGPEDPSGPDERREPPSEVEVKGEVAREILRMYEESYGKGATKAHTYLGENFVIVVLDDLELLPNEQFLVEKGRRDAVLTVRTQYQHAIQASCRAAIERATGRRVIGFASTASLDEPRFVAEIFKLE